MKLKSSDISPFKALAAIIRIGHGAHTLRQNGKLKNMPFFGQTKTGTSYVGKKNLTKIFSECLMRVQLDIPFHILEQLTRGFSRARIRYSVLQWELSMQLGKRSAKEVFFFLILSSFFCTFARAQDTPRYRVDASWPKELPHNWVIGHVVSLAIDKDDHIWILQFPHSISRDEMGQIQKPPLSICCTPAPAVLEFDAQGNVLKSWGGPGYVPDWPTAEQGLWVDKTGNVWITGSWHSGAFVRRPEDDLSIPVDLEKLPWDRQALKFSPDGKLLLEIGHPTKDGPINNQDTSMLGGASAIQVDENAHEVYFADGSFNRRVVAYDSETGKFKRGWGAYGISLSEIDNSAPKDKYVPSASPSKQFRGPMVGLSLSSDGFLYVSDPGNDRIQVFTREGKFVKEFFVEPKTLGQGSVAGLAFSRDPKQQYLFVADGSNNVLWVLNRNDGSVVTKFGHRGHDSGQFSNLETIAVDSHGNIYTGEVKYNNRAQKFVPSK
jgi:hypothetical protein